MQQKSTLHFSLWILIYPLFFGLTIWTVYWFELTFGHDFREFGIYPRTLRGLKGIIFSPFIHSSVEHLYSNTLPLMILSATLFYFYQKISWKVLLFGILLSGFFTWLIGRPAYHIGASGLIYVLVSFIFFKGIFTKTRRLVALSLVVVFVYGSMFWFIFPVEDKVSWEGHLSGFIVGLMFALLFKTETFQKEKYDWERADFNEADDPFLKHFDADGNFIENIEEITQEPQNPPLEVIYHYKNTNNSVG
ncbi:rhomboid family intramembrane serine protease [Joostella sp. CR20]|uniref:rhomboid family intramembrane serine protease n=1 Tax=Joostella sp. CR20 TaxID=2804312 RepID=UPI00313C98D2